MSRLLVIVSDRITNIIEKGELIDNYYNPGDYFDEVAVLLTNDDNVDKNALQKAVGSAKLSIYNLPTDRFFFLKTIGWRPFLMDKWAKKGVEIAKQYQPDLIRCYGNRLSGYLSSYIKKKTGIPYILSMHEAPKNIVKSEKSILRRIQYLLLESMGRISLANANVVIAVYDSIAEELKAQGLRNYVVIHNAVNGKNIRVKENYGFTYSGRVRILSVGRLIKIKNPENLIRAVAELENVELDIVGDGILYDQLSSLAHSLNAGHKVHFIKALNNDDLCQEICKYDIFAINCDGIGVPKTVIEAWLAGIPVLTNHPATGTTNEYFDNDNIMLVDNTPIGYKEGIQRYMSQSLRERIGNGGLRYAEKHFSPTSIIDETIALYEGLLKE